MSRQIQFRRGTADEHKNFTGAEGEITVDLTNKTLRVHDGVTAGGTMLARQSALDAADYVIAWQTPTAENNYTWYRKYKSGWVEQGGTIKQAISTDIQIIFSIPMNDINYVWAINTAYNSTNSPSYRAIGCWNRTKTSFTTRTDTNFDKSWYVCGQSQTN